MEKDSGARAILCDHLIFANSGLFVPPGVILGVIWPVTVEIGELGFERATFRGLVNGPEGCYTRRH